MDVSSIKRDRGNAQNENMTEACYSTLHFSIHLKIKCEGLVCFVSLQFTFFEHVIIYRK